jgi:hypothetical protein
MPVPAAQCKPHSASVLHTPHGVLEQRQLIVIMMDILAFISTAVSTAYATAPFCPLWLRRQ